MGPTGFCRSPPLDSQFEEAMTKTKTKVWERQADEHPKPWDAFVCYRDLGPTRSVTQALKVAGKKEGTRGWFERWSTKYTWVDRCVAYDAHCDKIHLAAADKETARWARTQMQAARRMLECGLASMEAGTSDLPPKEARQYSETGIKLMRLLSGEATERTESGDTIGIAEFRELRRKAAAEKASEDAGE